MQSCRTGDEFETKLAPLWALASAGDEIAYRQCLQLLAVRIRRYVGRRLSETPGEVEDLVQETLLAIHLKRETHKPSLPVANWALSIARYKLVDHWRRSGRRAALAEPFDDAIGDVAAWGGDDIGAGVDVAGLLELLPDNQRRAIVLTKLEGLSVAEAASRIGISVSALKVRVHRGLARLADLVRKAP